MRLSINEDCNVWAKNMKNIPSKDRRHYNNIIAETKYSMDNSIESLCNIYKMAANHNNF